MLNDKDIHKRQANRDKNVVGLRLEPKSSEFITPRPVLLFHTSTKY